MLADSNSNDLLASVSTTPLAVNYFEGINTETTSIIHFYHSAVFYHFYKTYSARIGASLHEKPLAFRRSHFLSHLPRKSAIGGQAAWNTGMEYLTATAARIAAIIGPRTVPYWIHLYRRIGVSLSPGHDSKTDAMTLGWVRSILELGITKYGNLSLQVQDTARTSQIRLKDILGGHFQRVWEKRLKRASSSEKRAIFENVMNSDQWVLTKFGLQDFTDIYEIEGLAYEYWRTMAWMRALGKGAQFILEEDDDWPNGLKLGKLRRLIRSYDTRIETEPFSAALVGSWFGEVGQNADLRGNRLFFPSYNLNREPAPRLITNQGLVEPSGASFKPNFLLTSLDLEQFQKAHTFLAEEFKSAMGCTFDGFLMCLWGLCNIAAIPPRVIATAAEEGEAAGVKALENATLNLLQRAYILFSGSDEDLLREIMSRLENYTGSLSNYYIEDLRVALEHITLRDIKRDQISLWSGGRRFLIVPINEGMLIDPQGVPWVLNSLFYRLQYVQTARGFVFEEAFRKAIERSGFALERVGEIRNKAGARREIDASVRIENKLILFECRTIERPLDFEIGRPKTIEARNAFLSAKVDQALSLRQFILDQPVGLNYDFAWATDIESFIVSPFVEWIWDDDERLWYNAELPRIVQASEALQLLQALAKGS